MLLYVSNAIIS